MNKRLGFAAIAACGLLLLSGCSSSAANKVTQSAATTSNKCINLQAGSVSDSVKVTFKTSANPTLKVDTPIKSKVAERTVLTKGTGASTAYGDSVLIKAAIYSGTSGKLLQSVGYTTNQSTAVTASIQQFLPGLVRAIECLPVGSKTVTTAPRKWVVGSATSSQTGIADSEKSLILVTSIDGAVPSKATGVQQSAPKGFPKVTLAANGTPTVGSTKGLKVPTKTKVGLLKKGTGAKVTKSSTVTIHYTGLIWKSGKVFDSSWTNGSPISQSVSGFVTGFKNGLIGQTVGSQVIIAIPPKDGYGNNPPSGSGIGKKDTLLFVVDILAAS